LKNQKRYGYFSRIASSARNLFNTIKEDDCDCSCSYRRYVERMRVANTEDLKFKLEEIYSFFFIFLFVNLSAVQTVE